MIRKIWASLYVYACLCVCVRAYVCIQYVSKINAINSNLDLYKPFKDEAQTALFKDPVRTAL